MINSSDISVVIQGPIDWSLDEKTYDALTLSAAKNIRKIFPECEIILSTWNGEKLDGIIYDRLVLSDAPEAQGNWPSFAPSNVNRQIVGTIAGLEIASRKYCLKIRSDMIIEGTNFLQVFDEHCIESRAANCSTRIFRRPVLTNNFSSRNTEEIVTRLGNHPLPFHPSDHLQFGLVDDLRALWDIPLQSDDDAWHFIEHTYPNRWRMLELSRLTPEQYICISALEKKSKIGVLHYADDRPEIIKLSDSVMSSQFFSLPDKLMPVRFQKYHTAHHFAFEWMRRNDLQLITRFDHSENNVL